MRIVKATFNRDRLLAAPDDERALFLTLGHLANEANALNKLLLWANEADSPDDARAEGRMTFILLVLRLLAGKIKEGWELLQKGYYGTAISRSYDPDLIPEGREALSEIKRYFSSDNLISDVRNTYAFHYSPRDINESFADVPETLHLYMEQGGTTNNLYYFSELAAAGALLALAATEDDPIGYLRFQAEVIKMAGHFAVAADALMTHFLKLHGVGIWEGPVEEVVLAELPELLSVKLPWFTDPTSAYDAHQPGAPSDGSA